MSSKYHHARVSVCYCVSIIIRLRVFLRVSDICRGAGWGVREAGWKHG